MMRTTTLQQSNIQQIMYLESMKLSGLSSKPLNQLNQLEIN